jgi:hypothetical protein
MKQMNRLDRKVEFLFRHPIKFHPMYLAKIDARKLEILTIALGFLYDVEEMTEAQRRKLFDKCLYVVMDRIRTWEELVGFRVALGFPLKHPGTMKIAFRKAVDALIEELKREVVRISRKKRIKADFRTRSHDEDSRSQTEKGAQNPSASDPA